MENTDPKISTVNGEQTYEAPEESPAKAEKKASAHPSLKLKQAAVSGEGTDGKDAGGEDIDTDGGNKFLAMIFDWAELFVISLAIVVVLMTFFVRHSPVIGLSMEPTVDGQTSTQEGDVMLISNLFYTPKTGDVVVINSPRNLSEPIIKRVIAVGGDTVEIYFEEWKTVVNGVELDEAYLFKSYPVNGVETNPNLLARGEHKSMNAGELDKDGDKYEKFVVPEGEIFVMGDNRNNSMDSRSIGTIDERYTLGKVLLRVSPFEKFGSLG